MKERSGNRTDFEDTEESLGSANRKETRAIIPTDSVDRDERIGESFASFLIHLDPFLLVRRSIKTKGLIGILFDGTRINRTVNGGQIDLLFPFQLAKLEKARSPIGSDRHNRINRTDKTKILFCEPTHSFSKGQSMRLKVFCRAKGMKASE